VGGSLGRVYVADRRNSRIQIFDQDGNFITAWHQFGQPSSVFVGPDDTLYVGACKMGLEGIVSKRKASSYRSGRSPDWLKSKNPACAAVQREAKEDWGR
jgi:DNA-binding beta-propeller fold protein YncE